MDHLAKQQTISGQEIQQIVSNYRKDSKARQTKEYFVERLRRLEGAWNLFEGVDSQIRTLPDPPLDHPYFANEYYEAIRSLHEQYTAIFREKIAASGLPEDQNAPAMAIAASFEQEEQKATAKNTEPSKQVLSKAVSSKVRDVPTTKQASEITGSEVNRIMRKQGRIITMLKHILSQIATETQERSKQYFDIKINTVNKYWSQIQDCDQSIWELIEDPSMEGYDGGDILKLEAEVESCLISLATHRDNVQQFSSGPAMPSAGPPVSRDSTSTVRLPKFTLPKFDGDYLKWTQFHDLFEQMVHSQAIPNCQKMWYLKANLSGEAEKLIRHFAASEENYATAWQTLKDRYNNKRLLVTALLNKLLSQPAYTNDSSSAAAIKSLHDTTQECLMGLQNLKISISDWDPLLLHILIKKLDRTTHILYEQALANPREIQTIKGFLSFLETRFQSLEALGIKAKHEERNRGHTKPLTSVIATSIPCKACKADHPLFACNTFLGLTPHSRLNLLRKHNLCINCLKSGHNTRHCTLRGCKRCNQKHNTLVHFEPSERDNKSLIASTEGTKSPATDTFDTKIVKANRLPATVATLTNHQQRTYTLLGTAMVKLVTEQGNTVECRAILDSGSQVNLITERTVKKLKLTPRGETITIHGIGNGHGRAQHRVSLSLKSTTTGFSTRIEALVLKQILPPQPSQLIDTSAWEIPSNIQLADPHFYQPRRIDLLIGAEHYYQLLSIGQIKLGAGMPTLQKTVLGWIPAGRINQHPLKDASCGVFTTSEDLDQQLEKFWQLEEITDARKALTPAEKQCEEQFNRTVRRTQSGRFVVKLPFTGSARELGQSRDIAYRRFLSIERKLLRNDELRSQYSEFMKEYENLGHMQEINIADVQAPYYVIPHHCVSKPDSTTTKLRVVFDASCKTSSNVSLNDILAAGPTIQDELFSILLRFRLPRFVFTADIEKMYRQILIDGDERKFQLIVWRSDPSHQLKYYQLNTVTYGTTSAPYLATKCLQKLAQDASVKYPLGAKVLSKDFYVDDVMSGSNSLASVIESQRQVRTLLQDGGFKLRKWCANHHQLLTDIPPEDRTSQLTFDNFTEEQIKILGLTWLPTTDLFRIKISWTEATKVSKRTVCSDIARIFDPLGIMSPVVITAKIFLQELWKLKIDWDSSLPMEMHTRWLDFRKDLQELNEVTFSRHVFAQHVPKYIQIHTFADASQRAYGAAVYVRSINPENQVIVRLLCAKSKVKPIKEITIPRLELCAAKLAAELTDRIKNDLKLKDAPTYLWTDSQIVLGWLNSTAASFHTFVANRVDTIQGLSTPEQWRHVRSADNPADMLTRGVPPRKLKECTKWFYGPLFLHGAENSWPQPYHKTSECTLERKRVALSVTSRDTPATSFIYEIDHRNSFARLQRIVAYILRYTRKLRRKSTKADEGTAHSLTARELSNALLLIVKCMQEEYFRVELRQLTQGELARDSSLNSLAPFLDEEGIMRVGGRLQEADISYDSKHPILLPYAHQFTKLLMTDIHIQNLHVGPQTLLSITRQRFWPIKGKTIARSIVQHCVRCTRVKPTMLSQMMGNLPAHRVQPARPFVNVGIDFCGPIWTHFKIRGKRPQKSYIAVFCCFTTKAIHLELVSDLTTQAFLGALKRFMGRRGHCRNIYCDNATNFVGARNELKELNDVIHSDRAKRAINTTCESKGTDFHFIPPRAPHFGGLWEAAVKSAKHLLVRTIGNASLTYEELETVVIQIEAILNSRPLTSMSSNPNDLSALTPGHFLIGEPITSNIDARAEPEKASLLTRWKLVTHLKNEFWKRWTREYLNELQQRQKWKHPTDNLKPGTLVIIKDDNVPALKWPMGRIVNVIKGDDGLARVADVRVPNNIIRRPIHKLAPLPVAEETPSLLNQPPQATVDNSRPPKATVTNKSTPGASSTTRDRGPSTSAVTNHARKRARLSLGHAVTTILLVCLCLPATSATPIEITPATPIEITPFKGHIGLHFENLGTASIISNEWNLVVFYDMANYWREVQGLINGTRMLQDLCKSITREKSCEAIVTQMEHLRNEIEGNNQMVMPASNRMKRGALNFVGNIANALFGVLDSDYAENMARTIEAVKSNEEQLVNLAKNQTSIMDATINLMKKNQDQVSKQFRDVECQVNALVNFTHILSMEIHQEKLTLLFTSLSIQTLLISSNIQRAQALIMDVIADTHHGHVSPQLITPNQLKQQLFKIKGNLAPSLKLPVEPNEALKLYNLMKVAARATEGHIIFKIHIPLLALDRFELFRILPVPTLINSTFVAIQPSSPFIIVDLHRDAYYPLTEAGLQSCMSVQEDHHICKQTHPLYKRGSGISACEISLINDEPLPPMCQFINLGKESQWIQMNNQNQWIFAVQKDTVVKIVCGTNVTSTTIEGSGILKITGDCIIKQRDVTIQGHNIRPTIARTSYTAVGSVADIVNPKQLSSAVNPVKPLDSYKKEFESLRKKLDQQLSDSVLPSKIRVHDAHQLAIGYIAASLATCIGVWLLWRFTPNFCKRSSRKPTPHPRRRTNNDFTVNM